MKAYKSKQFLSMILALAMIVTCLITPGMAAPAAENSAESGLVRTVSNTAGDVSYVEGDILEDLNKEVTIMVRLEGETAYQKTGDLQIAAASSNSQLATLARAESRIEACLNESIDIENTYSLLFNGFSFTGEAWMIDQINELNGVYAFESPMLELIEPTVSEETALTPSMGTSTGLTGATNAWELGYTGEGMVVAVIDSGILTTHEAFSVLPENGKIDLDYLSDVYTKYGDKMHGGSLSQVEEIYKSAKLPFTWDYFDHDADPNHTASDHGTHVAGIAAGNNGSDFKGVAPDAQIVVMQVFMDTGGASFATLICALEDCVYLGVDAINMSLGMTAGHTAYESIMPELEGVYDALENAGISVASAAGNDGHVNSWTNYGDYFYNQYRWLALNPDVGTVGAPGTFLGSFCVASVQNTSSEGGCYLDAYGKEFFPSSVAGVPTLGELQGGEYDIVYVGLGSPEEIEAAGGVEGKIALAKRGTLTFTAKCENAAAAGAVGVILFNNVAGALNPSVTCTIPFGTMTLEDGENLIANFADGVHGKVTVINEFAYGTVAMASTSSWGTTADLRITPEIAAPGDNITSCIGFGDDTSYATWSGTSMATPHISGGLLLIKERLREEFPNASASEINDLAYAFMSSTAHQVQGFVRQQGAGLMDLGSALTTDAYLTVPGANRSKLELDDSEDGSFTFSFEVNNIGDTEKTYTIVPSVLTESVADFAYNGGVMNDREYNLETGYYVANPEMVIVKTLNGTVKDVTNLCDITAPETVTVPAGETVVVNMTIQCNDELMAYFKENCPVGMYLEGFIKLKDQAEDGVNLSIPFLGFVGDWDYAPMFDQGFWWQIPYGENNLSQLTATQGTYIGYGILEQGLGLNPYAEMAGQTYLADRNAISPNGDDFLDSVNYVEFSLMRNPRNVKLYVQDAEGNVLQTFYDSTYNFRKDYYSGGAINAYTSYSSLDFDFTADTLAENETAYIVLEASLDHDEFTFEDNMNGRMVFPVTKDLTAPAVKVVDGGIEIIDANYTAYYAIYADEARTELLYETGVFADARGVAETYETDLKTLYVATADYARNEAFYKVEDGLVYELSEDAFGHNGKTVVARQFINYDEGVYQYGWTKFNTETAVTVEANDLTYEMNEYAQASGDIDYVSAAVAVDGTIYLNTFTCLFTLDPETYEVTKVADFICNDMSWYQVKDLMVNPETGEMYAYVSGSFGLPYIYKLNTETGELTQMWEVTDIPGANQLSFCAWSACFIDGSTVAVYGHYGDVGFYDLETGEGLYYINLNLKDPKWGFTEVGIYGYCGSMLYDDETNCIYMFSNWGWLRHDRMNEQGMVVLDLDTNTVTLRSIGRGGQAMHGLYFEEDAKPADYYTVMMLIDAIGEVTLDSGEAIEDAREAYDALPEKSKAKVENYQDLLDAEAKYASMKLEADKEAAEKAAKAAEEAQKAAEEAQKKAEEAQKKAEEAQKAAEEAAASAAENKEAAEKAKAEAEAAKEAAEAAQKAAEDAQKAAEAARDAAAAHDAAAAEAAAEAAKCALEVAEKYEEICAMKAEMAQYLLDAQKAAEEAEAAKKAAQEAELACAKYYALMQLSGYADKNDYAQAQQVELAAAIEAGTKAINEAENIEAVDKALADAMAAIDAIKTLADLEAEKPPFVDVAEDAWYYDAVKFAYNEKLFKGATDTTFNPNGTMTRAMLVTVLYRLAGEPEVTGTTAFTDLKDGEYYCDAVLWAVQNGITEGVDETHFAPNKAVTREQMVTFLYRYAKLAGMDVTAKADLSTYADADKVGTYAADAMAWAVANELINGVGNNTLAPKSTATRAQVAVVLMRYLAE